VWNEARSYIETAAEENREMTAEENGTWQRLMEELDNIDSKLEGVLTAEKRAGDTDAAFNAIGKRPVSPEAARYADSNGRDLNAEIRSFLKGEKGGAMEVTRPRAFTSTELRILQSNTGTPTSIIPTDFYDQLIAHLIEVSGVMQAGPTVLNTAGGETLQVPKTTQHSISAGLTAAQAATLPSSDPAFAMATLSSYKYGILLQVARELIDDSGQLLQAA
jgi:HK97 family phage major capsid protein